MNCVSVDTQFGIIIIILVNCVSDLGSAGVSLGVSYSDHENKGARGQGR